MYMDHFYYCHLSRTQQIPYAASGFQSTCKHKHHSTVIKHELMQNSMHRMRTHQLDLQNTHTHTLSNYKSYPKWNKKKNVCITIDDYTVVLLECYEQIQRLIRRSAMKHARQKKMTTVKWCTQKSRNCGRLSFPSFLLCWHSI